MQQIHLFGGDALCKHESYTYVSLQLVHVRASHFCKIGVEISREFV